MFSLSPPVHGLRAIWSSIDNVTTISCTICLPSNNVSHISRQFFILYVKQAPPSNFDPLPISLDSLDLIIPDFRSEPTFLNRECDSLSSSFLDVNKEPNDYTGQNTIDEPRMSDRSSFGGGFTYRKMKACQVLPVLAMMAAQIFGPTRELTLLKIP